MTDADRETIDAGDATLEVVDDPADAGLVVTGVTVSGSQKENLGDYENYEPHASVKAEFRPALRVNSPDAESEVEDKLRVLRRVVDDHLQKSIRNVVERRTYE